MITQNNTQTITGAKVIIETLKKLSVDTVFGYPGGIVLDLYDELYKQNDIKHILMRHEQAAVHAAEGYARATGKSGVVFVTSGPGATNTVTGIANAYLDGFPLVVITGQVFKDLIGTNAFQEANICKITEPCSKKVYQVSDADNLQNVLYEAFETANSGKKGPVVIDITKDVFSQNTNILPSGQTKKENNYFDTEKAQNIITGISESERPVIIAGGGVHHAKAYNELQNFADTSCIPVVSTMMGKGSISTNDKHYIGMAGIFGDNSANEILKQSDLIISLGARLNDRITCMFKDISLPIVQIDINPEQTFLTNDILIADIKEFLTYLNKNMKTEFSQWLETANKLKKLNTKREKTNNMLHSFEVMRKLDEFTKDKDVTFTSEVGQHLLWAIQNIEQTPKRRIFVSGGSGTMGFGFPAAIGAAVACPEKTIICITGDGSFQMSLEELAVCKDYGLNIKIMILNNGYLGMVRQLQQNNCDRRYSQTKISNPDFVKLAQSYGIEALKVNSYSDIDNALNKAFNNKNTFIIDFEIEPMETV